MNLETAALNARYELDALTRRADCIGPMGALPTATPFFRRPRHVAPLTAIVEICHPHHEESEAIARRLRDLSPQASHAERKAS